MENVIINGRISATSNKVDGEFKQEVPTKTAYVEVTNDTDRATLTKLGMTEYTSKSDDVNFYIIKLPKQVSIFKGNEMHKISGGVKTPNFKTPDDKELKFNIIKGNNKGNDFFRLQAVLVDEYSDIEEIQMENPFGTGKVVDVSNQFGDTADTADTDEFGF